VRGSLERARAEASVVAVLVPAFDEAQCVGQIVREFVALKREFSDRHLRVELHVIDNGSTDATAEVAASEMRSLENCHLHHVALRGKGNAVRWGFANIHADVYALVDCDLTYSLNDIPALAALVTSGTCEMAIGDRLTRGAYRRAHGPDFRWAANHLISWVIASRLQQRRVDALSGLRVLDGRLARRMNLRESGFALETELMFEAARLGSRVQSLPAAYRGRPSGSESKLVTGIDGPPILWTLLRRLYAHRAPSRRESFARVAVGAHLDSVSSSER